METFEENEILYLRDTNSSMKPIYIDFSKYIVNNRELLKACGIDGRKNLRLLDCTAGLAKDTFSLAANGCEVLAIEKNKIVFDLIENAVKRGKNNEYVEKILNKIEFLNDDSINFLENTEQKFDCIYLDPMFEESKKSRLVKKNMQFFHKLTDNSNNEKLFELAIKKAVKRTVIKRALHGEYLVNKKPSFQIRGKTIRFDVYLC